MLRRPPSSSGPARVLVVDDMEENRRALTRVLGRLGHQIVSAGDGVEALEKLAAEPFELVLLDVEMPRRDGIAVLEELKAGPLAELPVIMVSAIGDDEAIARCIDLGADDFIGKPFEPRFVAARVRSSLARKRLRDWERVYLAMLEEEQQLSGRLIADMLPDAIATRLKHGETTIADHFADVSVVFADIVGFTGRAATMESAALVALLNAIFSDCDARAAAHRLEKIKTIGDAYMAVGGIPEARPDHLESAARFALETIDATRAKFGVEVRVGLHCGPAVAGVIGTRKLAYDIWGHTVNLASRMESHGAPGRVHVSAEVRDRLEGRFHFEARGSIDIKGQGPLETYFLVAGR